MNIDAVMRRATQLMIPLLGLVTLLSCNTPQSTCEDTLDAINDMYTRCKLLARLSLVKENDEPATCEDINQLNDDGRLLCECVPWTETVSCDEIRDDPFDLPDFCDLSQLEYFD